jgi:hypothetical protein
LMRIPLVACSAYGGTASAVWEALKSGKGMAEEKELDNMALLGSAEMVKNCVASLKSQLKRRNTPEHPNQKIMSIVTLLLIVVFAVSAAVTFPIFNGSCSVEQSWALFLVPVVAAALGTSARYLRRELRTALPNIALGTFAGQMCGYVYVASQLVSVGSTKSMSPLFFLFAALFSIGGGFTADRVLEQMEAIKALKAKVLTSHDETRNPA